MSFVSSVLPPAMDLQRDLVIKVKYGDALKRLTASVALDNLDLDIAKLREKIIMAFNLSPSADFILTYTDLDGDTVMLDDDNDLCDAAINQKLNPLRINVQLKPQSNAAPAAEPKPKPTNSTSPTPLDGLNQISSSLEEALKSLPEPLNSTISKVTQDIVAKAVSSPVLNELLSAISKAAVPQGAQSANVPSGNSSSSASGVNKTVPKASRKATQASTAEKGKEPKAVLIPEKEAKSELPNATSSEKTAGDNNYADKKVTFGAICKGKAAMPNVWQKAPMCGPPPGPQPMWRGPHHHPFAFPRFPPFGAPPPPPPQRPDFPGFPVENAFSGSANSNSNANAFTSDIPPYPSRFLPGRHPCRKADGFDSMFQACHKGVACDGCDMSPIVGPRYKSIVKDDYDLCAACFSSFGKEAEYTKIERPRMTVDINDLQHPKFHVAPQLFPMRGPKARSKLESRFIQDVTVPDGTIMPPSTPFTKIWRMRNNGSSHWPFGTQLVWVGGDQLSRRVSFQLEISVNGLPFDEEVDVAVDFSAPARAGRYVSYWRLASPSGQKFGQRVWVLFQVEQPDNSKKDNGSTINLNLPPGSCDYVGTETGEMTELENPSEPVVKSTATNTEPIVDESESPIIEPEPETAPVNGPEPETAPVNGPNPSARPTVSYPLIDLSPTPPIANPGPSVPSLEVPVYNSEDVLLKELEEMGFKQIDLNKEVLRLNKYDLEQSVEDLCGFSEWDPLLDELKEMGFDDKEKNKKLLVKNGGSIKRVVMDLITGEKAE